MDTTSDNLKMAAPGSDFDPSKNSLAHLASHVLQKGFQAGSVIGVLVVAPIMCYRSRSVSLATINKAAAYSSCVGTVLSGTMLAAKMQSMDQEGLEDRVYRLHYNAGQNRVDRFCQMGGVVGGLAAATLVSSTPVQMIGGAAVGSFLAVGAHAATFKSDKKGPNMMLEELKTSHS